MPYHHIILPLASRRDKETEVRWGIAHFKRLFRRDPVGFWLPETAVDRETLDVLAAEGIQFTVLAPHQVSKPPAHGLPARIAVDGETFGHHHQGANQTLATVIHRLQRSGKAQVTNFAAALATYPPATTVDLVERTSWSCPHGVERWRSACGCKVHTDRPSQQDWRAPLRYAVEWLAHEVHGIYDREGRDLPGGS